MAKSSKTRASKQAYISPSQLIIEGFETPFSNTLDAKNRWIQLAHRIPWDSIVPIYEKQMHNGVTGASNVNARVVLGAIIIKHTCGFSDEETILQIQENMYMQYFIGYSSFSNEAPFDSSLFVEIRKRLGVTELNAINNKIVELSTLVSAKKKNKTTKNTKENPVNAPEQEEKMNVYTQSRCKGQRMSLLAIQRIQKQKHMKEDCLWNSTACPQDIAYPTDLNLLNDAREKSQELIDIVYAPSLHGKKRPRTYREQARKLYLNTAMKKNKSRKEICKAIRKQLNYLKRNLNHIEHLLPAYKGKTPLNEKQQVYLSVIKEVQRQQRKMYDEKSHSIEDRIVSIHQPHVRPIVRGKEKAKVEFGAKIQVSLVAGYAFLDILSWDAFNEGGKLILAIENHKARTGYYPKEVLADQIYCTRENRMRLKEMDIRLLAKPLGRYFPKSYFRFTRRASKNPLLSFCFIRSV
jgi:transposase, IS5 family